MEDEPIAQEMIQDYIEKIPSLELIGVASNAQEAMHYFQKKNSAIIDLLFLDIRMPRFTGYDLLEFLPQPLPHIVVTTAYRKYALQGYEFKVVDFLLKPFEFERFNEAVGKVEEKMGVKRELFLFASEEEQITNSPGTITVKVDRNIIDIPHTSILYIESFDNYVKIYKKDTPGKYILTKAPLIKLIEALPTDEFIRINRRFVVRIDQIEEMKGSTLILSSNVELPVGITFRDTTREQLVR